MSESTKILEKEVLVTGTTGFLGRTIKEQLEAQGYQVFGTTNRG